MQASKLLCCVNIFRQTIGSLAAHRLYRHSPMITIVTDIAGEFSQVASARKIHHETTRYTQGENTMASLTKKKKTWGRETERKRGRRAAASRPCSGPPRAGRSPSCGSTPAKISPKAAGLPPLALPFVVVQCESVCVVVASVREGLNRQSRVTAPHTTTPLTPPTPPPQRLVCHTALSAKSCDYNTAGSNLTRAHTTSSGRRRTRRRLQIFFFFKATSSNRSSVYKQSAVAQLQCGGNCEVKAGPSLILIHRRPLGPFYRILLTRSARRVHVSKHLARAPAGRHYKDNLGGAPSPGVMISAACRSAGGRGGGVALIRLQVAETSVNNTRRAGQRERERKKKPKPRRAALLCIHAERAPSRGWASIRGKSE